MGTYVAIIYVDENGNITTQGATATDVIQTGSTQPVESGAVADEIQNITDIASSLPTDSVLHYSFDDVPDYPNGTAILYRNHNFTDFIGFDTNNFGSLSVVNGELVDTVTNRTFTWMRRVFSSAVEGVIKFKIRVNKSCDLYLLYYNGSDYVTVKSITNANPNQDYIITAYVPSTQIINIQVVVPTAQDFQVILSEFYLGDGSYSTPVIDNANGQYNSISQSGVAVQGVSGKAIKMYNGNGITTGKSTLTDEFTISLWVNPENTTSGIWGDIISKNMCLFVRNGDPWANTLLLLYWNNNISNCETRALYGQLLEPNTYTHLVLVKQDNTVYCYINGLLATINNFETTINHNNNNIGISSNGRTQSVDDLLIFDRALSESEVLALYQNRANTPKYFPTPTKEIKQDSWELATSGGVFEKTKALMSTRIDADGSTTAELCSKIVNGTNATACCGSQQITDGPDGNTWYNFMYIPHRNGIDIDGYQYGTLLLWNMTFNTSKMWINHLIGGSWYGWLQMTS